jgi:UDP-GlcNAc:undecaprenyl-phosphate GlcNAc-1-phosphate transferase
MFSNNQYFYLVYGVFFLLSIIFSLLINRLFLNFVKTLGIRNQGEAMIRWSSQTKPAVGGFSFYIIYLLAIVSFSIFFDSNKVFLNKEFIGILLATMLGFLLGLTDDAYNTKPILKLAAQITCGVILMITGTTITVSSNAMFNSVATVFWVVGIMNSLNMLDNMDGITSTVSISILLSALSVMVIHKDYESVYFMSMTGVMAALLGFLYYNWNPSKMYMGDTGSQFLGVFLAAMGIKFLWNAEPPSGDLISARNLLLPVIVFIMPIIDTTTVVINRMMKGRSPFVGGKDHTTHALAYLGFSDRQVAMVFWAITFISLIMVLIIERYLIEWNHFYTMLFAAYFGIMFSVFFFASKVHVKG